MVAWRFGTHCQLRRGGGPTLHQRRVSWNTPFYCATERRSHPQTYARYLVPMPSSMLVPRLYHVMWQHLKISYPTGIKIGEIGTKLGMNTTNNGYVGFDHVRIPRENMLMKNSQVLEDGTYVKAPNSKLTYGKII